MRLSRSYQPRTLDEVVGQPAVIRRLKRLVAWPQPCCLLFEGPGGVGKSATAKTLVRDLGVDPLYGVNEYARTDLLIKTCRELFEHTFRLAPMMGARWNVLVALANGKRWGGSRKGRRLPDLWVATPRRRLRRPGPCGI